MSKFLTASVAKQVAELANEWVNKEATKKKLEAAINKQFTNDLKAIITAACGCTHDKWDRVKVVELTPLSKMVYEKCEAILQAKMEAIDWGSMAVRIADDIFRRYDFEYRVRCEVEHDLEKLLDNKVQQVKDAALAHLDAAITALES